MNIGKDITVNGQGAATVIQSPAALALSYNYGGTDNRAIVFMHDTANAVTLFVEILPLYQASDEWGQVRRRLSCVCLLDEVSCRRIACIEELGLSLHTRWINHRESVTACGQLSS